MAVGPLCPIYKYVLSNPEKDWKDEIATVATVLDDTALHFTERKRFDVYLQYLIGLNAVNVGDKATLDSVLKEMETLGSASTFGIQLPGMKELKQRTAL